ncbi:MAG: hypothetical protein IJJ45_09290 [Clostridia bacterium]|nr:hypothetical protein [Clostridia bacterium]
MKRSGFAKKLIALVVVCAMIAAMVPAMASYSLVAKKKITIYSDPFLGFPLRSVPRYTVMRALGEKNGVAKLRMGGKTFYASTKNLITGSSILMRSNIIWDLKVEASGYVYCYPSEKAPRRRVHKGGHIYGTKTKKGWGLVVSASGRYVGYVKLH